MSKVKSFFSSLKKKVKKFEMNKKLCILGMVVIGIIGVYSIIHFGTMEKLAIETGSSISPSSEVAVESIRTIFAFFLGYCGYNGVLKVSRNRHGIDKDGTPYTETIREYIEKVKEEQKGMSKKFSADETEEETNG